MRENANASFTPYEWLPINRKMQELGMNRYEFFRYCVLKECGVLIDRNPKTKNEKPNIRREEPRLGESNKGNQEPINDLDETDS